MINETPAEVLADMKARAEFDSANADELDEFRERLERSLAAGKVATPWTDEECIEFACVAFRHAPKNLPKGVTLDDIRLGAQRIGHMAPQKVTRENESSVMLALADFIASSAYPEDPRLEVAYSISRHLDLGWSAADPAKASGSAPDVETVARKLYESEQRSRRGEWTWDECSSIEREGWTELAQAAIEILQPATPPASAPAHDVLESLAVKLDNVLGGCASDIKTTEFIACKLRELAKGVAPDSGEWVSAEDVRRLTRLIDVCLNGEEGAAPNASLCDIASQLLALSEPSPILHRLYSPASAPEVTEEAGNRLRGLADRWIDSARADKNSVRMAVKMKLAADLKALTAALQEKSHG